MADPILKVFPLDFHWPTLDPFLFCAHHHDRFPSGNGHSGPSVSVAGRNIGQDFEYRDGWNMYHGKSTPGFPVHPHRGFETVTVVREGLVDHADSLGAAGRYGNGDVQWLTTGSGVQHSEMFPLVNIDKPNPLLLFQVWLNLPSKSKMAKPHFDMFWKQDIPVVTENGSEIELIAGELKGMKAPAPPPSSWAADPDNEVAIWHITLHPGATFELPVASGRVGRVLYFYDGDTLQAGEKTIGSASGIQLLPDQCVVLKNGDSVSRLLLLQGKPIAESVAQHGPFVMNTQAEVQQAFQDYRSTQFGGWPWGQPDPVHRDKGRFALHADGREESPIE